MSDQNDGRIFMKPLPPWEAGTFAGAEYEALRRGAAMSFQERLEWIEQVTTLFTGEESAPTNEKGEGDIPSPNSEADDSRDR
jgi:hypothetical protein